MKSAINQWAFTPDTSTTEALNKAKQAGFEGFEIALGFGSPVSPGMSEKEAIVIRRHAESIDIDLTSLACGLGFELPLTSPDLELTARAIEVNQKALQVAHWLGVDSMLLVPGVVSAEIPYDIAFECAHSNLAKLLQTAEHLRVSLAIENVWNKFLLSPLEFRDFIDSFGSSYVGAHFDVGNIVLYGYPEQWVRILGSRIRMVHAKDFKSAIGTLEGFVMLQEGDVNWPAVMAAFREINYDRYLVGEFFASPDGTDAPLELIQAGLHAILAM